MYNQQSLTDLSGEDKKKKRNQFQMEMIMLESDNRKKIAEKGSLEAEIRKLRYDEERLRINLEEKKKRLDIVTREIADLDGEVKKIKKQINLLI